MIPTSGGNGMNPLFDKNETLLDICWDNVFKAVFTKETRDSRTALSRLVSAIIGRELEALDITANEPAADSTSDRQIRFDINCRTADGERVNVEMCLNPDSYELARLEFYAARLFCSQDMKGADKTYGELKPTYQIAILVNRALIPGDDFFHEFGYYDHVRGVSLGGKTRILTLELSKLEEVARKEVGEMSNHELWAVFFRYLRDPSMREKLNEIAAREEGIAMAGTVLMGISRNEAERARLESEYKYEIDLQSKLGGAKREGRLEGRLEGRQEGLQEGMLKVAMNALAEGTSVEFVRRITGLDTETITVLQTRQ